METFIYDLESIREYLDKINSDSEKLEIMQSHLLTTKRLINLLENTKVVDRKGIYTLDRELQDLVSEEIEIESRIFKNKITANVLKDILTGLKNRLTETYIYLDSEVERLNSKKKESLDIGFQGDISQQERLIKNEMDSIVSEIEKMGIKTKSVKTFLQEKLKEGIWEKYKDPKKGTTLGLLQKAFARKYFWEYGIKETKRYKDFESFYKNIFLK